MLPRYLYIFSFDIYVLGIEETRGPPCRAQCSGAAPITTTLTLLSTRVEIVRGRASRST